MTVIAKLRAAGSRADAAAAPGAGPGPAEAGTEARTEAAPDPGLSAMDRRVKPRRLRPSRAAPAARIGDLEKELAYNEALGDEFYLGRIAPGQSAGVEIAGRHHALEVSKVYPNVRDRQFRVDLEFVEAGPRGLRD